MGLAVGMTCFLFIMLYVQNELSYDCFYAQADRIYRVAVEAITTQGTRPMADTPYPLGPAFKQEYPEVEKLARFYFYGKALLAANEKRIYEKRFAFADSDFFAIFSFPMLRGNPAQALREPNTVVLTQTMAQKYFGNANPLGQAVRFENKVDLTVTGVVEDVPVNSHFRFDFLASFPTVTEDLIGISPLEQWGVNYGIYTYALLPANLTVKPFEEKIARFFDKHVDPESSDWRKTFLQPLTGIHLYSHLEDEFEPNNHPSNLYIISTIGLLILFIASINFMNLTAARSVRRAKEVGMRKVLGAVKGQLLKQFLGESLFLAFMAMLLGMVLVELLLPAYSTLIGKSLHFKYSENWPSLAAIIGMATFVGVISGIYPALVLSAYKPVETLKGMKSPGQMRKGALYLKKILVVTQFAISVFLIASTLVIEEQLAFFKEANLGFKKDLTVVIPMSDKSTRKQYQVIKNEIERLPNVMAVTSSFNPPIGENGFTTSLYPKGFEVSQERFKISLNFIDYDFIENFGIKLLAGRNFTPEFTTDFKNAFIVNESTIRKLGFVKAEEALGHKAAIGLDLEGTIIGVTEDFHIQSLHQRLRRWL
jgi:putative ABC transport system permease protein